MAIGLDIEQGAGQASEPTTEDINQSQIDDIQVVDSDTGELVEFPRIKDSDADDDDGQVPKPPQQPNQQQVPSQPQQPPQQGQQQQPDGGQQQPQIPQGFGSQFFNQETKAFEADKAFEFINKAGSFAFQPATPAPNAQQPAQQPQPPAQPGQGQQDDPDYPQWARELDQRHEAKQKAVLGPIESLYNAISQTGQLTPEQEVAFRSRYTAAKAELDNEYKREQNKLYAKQLTEYREVQARQASDGELKANAEKTFLRVGQDFGGEQVLRNLIAGEVRDGKHVPGPGTEVLNWLYTVQNGNKPMDQASLNRWYNETMANEGNVRMLGKIATSLWFMNTRDQYRDSVRASVLQEQAQKNAMRMKPPAVGSQPPGARQAPTNPVMAWMNE